ncbi:MAG: sulfotransferase [Thermoplasmata archaeon]|nr:MAG: sulfotransferase [Thermoplasmata archaeon]
MKKQNLDTPYLHLLENISFEPVFILGLHRSGTSILYKMVDSTGYFNSVTVYDIVYYNSLIYNHVKGLKEEKKEELDKYFKSKNATDRVIDRLEVSPDLPEEYGFHLNKKNMFKGLNEKNYDVFLELCKKVQFTNDPGKKLLLKNPWDFSNFMFIKKRMPNAKFIFIHRNPLRVINSTLKAFRTVLKKRSGYYDLISPDAKKLYENPIIINGGKLLLYQNLPIAVMIVVEHFRKATRYFLNNIPRLQEGVDFVEIRYEDLCREPVKNMERILEFLHIKIDDAEYFSKFVKPRKLILSKDVEMMKKYIYTRMKRYFSYCGYNLDTPLF